MSKTKENHISSMSVEELSRVLRSREISASEVTEAVLSRIRAQEDSIHAYITVTEELARENAAAADRLLEKGEGGILAEFRIP